MTRSFVSQFLECIRRPRVMSPGVRGYLTMLACKKKNKNLVANLSLLFPHSVPRYVGIHLAARKKRIFH